MKNLSRMLLVLVTIALSSVAASAQLNQFLGRFKNQNPATANITNLEITASGTNVKVHAWGKCSPSDCDWGTVDGYAYGPSVTSNLATSARAVSAIYRTSFSETILIIRPLALNRLQLDGYTRFTDSSGRTAYTFHDTFTRVLQIAAAEDCLNYNPKNLQIRNEGANGFLLTDGTSRMLMLDNAQDAANALALARRHTSHCFIGRNNNRPNREDFIVEYWKGSSGINTIMSNLDCISYNSGNLSIVDEGAGGFLLTDGNSRMLMLDNNGDAARAKLVAAGNTRQCFIGRNNNRPNRKTYIVEYWR